MFGRYKEVDPTTIKARAKGHRFNIGPTSVDFYRITGSTYAGDLRVIRKSHPSPNAGQAESAGRKIVTDTTVPDKAIKAPIKLINKVIRVKQEIM